MAALKSEHDLGFLLEIAGLAKSTFYYQYNAMQRPDRHAELKLAISEIFTASQARYGHRRVLLELRRRGIRVSQKTVWKLMRELGLKCKTRSRKRNASYRGDVGVTAPNLLNRDFHAAAPDQKWVTDVTEFRVGERKLYLSPVLDLHDRVILAYSVSVSPTVAFVCAPLQEALRNVGETAGLIVHSDQGFQYQHRSWQHTLAEAGATQSMSRKGNCLDNAVKENFFGHLKEEMFHHDNHESIEELETAIHAYIHWYNTERRSETLEGMSPMEYRTHALAA